MNPSGIIISPLWASISNELFRLTFRTEIRLMEEEKKNKQTW